MKDAALKDAAVMTELNMARAEENAAANVFDKIDGNTAATAPEPAPEPQQPQEDAEKPDVSWMLQAGLSVASNLYTPKSMGALKSSAGKSVGLQNYSVPGYTEMKGLPAHTGGGISSYSNDGWAKAKW